MTQAEKDRKKYHSDPSYREKVLEKTKRWQRKNKGYNRDWYTKKKVKSLSLEELNEFIRKHETSLRYAKDELSRRRTP